MSPNSSKINLPQKRKGLSPFKRNCIIGQHNSIRNPVEIEESLGLSQWTVRRVINKYEEENVKVSSPWPGRLNKLSKTDETALVLSVKCNPEELFAFHQNTFLQVNVDVCRNTAKKYLKDMGYISYSVSQKPLLTNVHKHNRRHWAMEHKGWTVNRWKNLIWFDESWLTVMGNDSFGKVVRREGERYEERYAMPTLNFGKGSVMVWGYFWPYGFDPLMTAKDSVDEAKYIECLDGHSLPWSKSLKRNFIVEEWLVRR